MNVNIIDTTNTINDGFQVVKPKKQLKKKKHVSTDLIEQHTETEKCMVLRKSKDKRYTGRIEITDDSSRALESQKSPIRPRVPNQTGTESEMSHSSENPPRIEPVTTGSSHKSSGRTTMHLEIPQNKKRVLCYSYVTRGECPYGSKCVYAHSIKEQNIDPLRKKVYDILNNNNPLNDIDFVHDNDLYKTFLQLTRTCYGCENNTCVGGYNCKKGAINLEHTICYDDLYSGECQYGDTCDKIHLTKRRLVPKTIQLLIMTGYTESDKNSYVKKLMNVTVLALPKHSGCSPNCVTRSTFMTHNEKSIEPENIYKHDDTTSEDSCDSLESYSSDEGDISKTVGESKLTNQHNKYILTLQPI
jgi:hypothetical protein